MERFFRTTAMLVRPWKTHFSYLYDLSYLLLITGLLRHSGPLHTSPPLDNRHLGRTQVGDNSYLLEATHRVDTLWHRSYWIYTSLFSLPPRHGWSKVIMCWWTMQAAPWLIQSDHVLMDDAKRSAAAFRRISWYLCQGYPSLFFEERPVSFVRGLLISFPYSPSCDLSSQGLLGRVLSAQELLLRLLGVPGCAIDSPTLFLSYYDVMESLAAPRNFRHRILYTLERIHWSSLCGLAVLHYIGFEEHLSGLWGRFVACSLYARPSHAVSPRPGLGKLLALSNFPAYVHFVIRVSQDITASVVLCFLILYVIGASFSLIECASCHRYLEPNGFSARILLLRAPSMTRIRNGSLVSDALFRGFLCFRICLINSFIVLANDCECFCCFSRTWNCPFRVVVADWRANRPGHVP